MIDFVFRSFNIHEVAFALGAIPRILVIALVLGKDRLTTLPRAIGTYLLAFFRMRNELGESLQSMK